MKTKKEITRKKGLIMKVIISENKDLSRTQKDFFAGDIQELQDQLAEYVKETEFIKFDECTGLYWVKYGSIEDRNCCEKTAREHFLNVFDTHCYLEKSVKINNTIKKQMEKISDKQISRCFKVAAHMVSYNARQWFIERIPEWDGKERIKTFLKDAYECDANPNHFLLFITKVVSMVLNPAQTYCPYWFDFVGGQGVGKSYLADWLLGGDGSMICKYAFTRSGDDFKYQPYSVGAIIAIDDECKLSNSQSKAFGKGTTIEEWRAYVADKFDTVRAVYKEEMTLRRSFVIIRTSNEVKITQETGERRQIIFESKLPTRECRLSKTEDYWKTNGTDKFHSPDGRLNGYYAQQVLAEALAYVRKNGQYELSEDDIKCQLEEQVNHVDIDNVQYASLCSFIEKIDSCIRLHKMGAEMPYISKLENVRNYNGDPGTPAEKLKYNGLYYFSYLSYRQYCIDHNVDRKDQITARTFWNFVKDYKMVGTIPIEVAEFYGLSTKSHAKVKAVFVMVEPAKF